MSSGQPIKLNKLDKSCMKQDLSINISVNNISHISSETAETVNFHLSLYKSMGTNKLQ